jgi:hypothetical protein
MKLKTLLIALALIPVCAFSQYEKMLETMEDEMETQENGKMVLRFINAETGNPVDSATITIERGGAYTTDLQGKAYIDPMPDKTYALRFTRNGFITASYDFEVVAGTIFYNRFSVSPIIEFGAMRVVLDWAKNPADLDAHLIKEGDYHISFQKMHLSDDGSAKLDRDDLKGFGPETITVKNIDNKATYTYYVKNFSDASSPNSKGLSKSKATVKIYGDNKLLKCFNIQPDKKGTTWMVFTLLEGKIIEKNEVGNQY